MVRGVPSFYFHFFTTDKISMVKANNDSTRYAPGSTISAAIRVLSSITHLRAIPIACQMTRAKHPTAITPQTIIDVLVSLSIRQSIGYS
jgi:hypothetical protein